MMWWPRRSPTHTPPRYQRRWNTWPPTPDTRVHNPSTGEKNLVRLPGLVSIAYQHETSRCGDPHLHTHVIVPNRQARADEQLVSIDGASLYHEAKAAGVIYPATLRRELHQSMGLRKQPGRRAVAPCDRREQRRAAGHGTRHGCTIAGQRTVGTSPQPR